MDYNVQMYATRNLPHATLSIKCAVMQYANCSLKVAVYNVHTMVAFSAYLVNLVL